MPTSTLPAQEEIDVLIGETLNGGVAIQELPFSNPVASVENFMQMRFFFPVHQWLNLYMAYRSSGDERIRETMLASARHYHQLSVDYMPAAQQKASDPEGLPFMYTMAASARITLQKAKQDQENISPAEMQEASDFLHTMVAVLKPTYEGDTQLDQKMGIPQAVADDFRSRAFNRALNGIGTMASIAIALEDYQAIHETQEFQPTIDRYRKTVREYIKNFLAEGHFCEFDDKKHFYYPYKAGKLDPVDWCDIFKRPEDAGHYSHSMQGLMLVYEAMPEVGIDDEFMTAVANAIYHNSTTKIKREGKMVLSGHLECPTMSRVKPYGNNKGGHQYSPARERFYYLLAFRDDIVDGLCDPMTPEQKEAANSDYDRRISTLFSNYIKALREDRSVIHL